MRSFLIIVLGMLMAAAFVAAWNHDLDFVLVFLSNAACVAQGIERRRRRSIEIAEFLIKHGYLNPPQHEPIEQHHYIVPGRFIPPHAYDYDNYWHLRS